MLRERRSLIRSCTAEGGKLLTSGPLCRDSRYGVLFCFNASVVAAYDFGATSTQSDPSWMTGHSETMLYRHVRIIFEKTICRR
jgi:hypothetical protein